MTLLHNVPGMRAKRLLAAGGGKPAKVHVGRVAPGRGRRDPAPKIEVHHRCGVWLDAAHAGADYVAAAVEGAILGNFETDRYKTDKKDAKTVERFTVVVAERRSASGCRRRARAHSRRSPELHAQLANEPPNRLTPWRWPNMPAAWRRSSAWSTRCSTATA
jgi:leucyl aminopeptidase